MLKFTGYSNLYLDTESGIYQVRKMIRGQERIRSTGKTTYPAAVRLVASIIQRMDEAKETCPTLNEWWTDYRKTKHKAPKTWRNQDNLMKPLLERFGTWRLNDIRKKDVELYLNERRARGDAPSTLHVRKVVLGAVLNAARESGLLKGELPTNDIKGKFAIRKRVLSLDEQLKLEAHLGERAIRWLHFAIGTGLRRGEIAGIRPKDIDFDKRTITVLGKGGKTRTVPLLKDELLDILRQDVPFVKKGHIDALVAACDKAGIARVSPHTMRHTFATRYLQGGGDIYILSKILGHANVGITQSVYAHLLTEDLAARSAHVNLIITPSEKVLPFKRSVV